MPALVDYTSSQDEDDEDPSQQEPDDETGHSGIEVRDAALPPLPSAFRALYATNVRSSNADDPELHGGRRRQVAHVSGNWPSHVYVEWSPSRYQLPLLKDIINAFQQASNTPLTSLVTNDLDIPQPLHISLSRSLQVATADRAALRSAIVDATAHAGPRAFHVAASGLRWVRNYDGSRWFLALGMRRPERDELNQLLRLCNACMGRLGYPLLYAAEGQLDADLSECFHFSIAWALASELDAADTGEVLERVWAAVPDKEHRFRVFIEQLCVKIGNDVHHLSLNRAPASSVA